jgi:hypothetical protein
MAVRIDAATAQTAFCGPRLACKRKKLGLVVAVGRPFGRPGALDEHGLEPGSALAQSRLPALSGALVLARTEAHPGDQMAGALKAAHVEADLGENGERRDLAPGIDSSRLIASQNRAWLARSSRSMRATRASISSSTALIDAPRASHWPSVGVSYPTSTCQQMRCQSAVTDGPDQSGRRGAAVTPSEVIVLESAGYAGQQWAS